MSSIALNPEEDPFADVVSAPMKPNQAEWDHVAYLVWIEDAPKAEVRRYCKEHGLDLFADDPEPEVCTGNVVDFRAWRATKAD
ncbi:hypothetical protein [Methylocella sp.]|uniref:hypothetical protein n=1 Tax=Methylocella sp. TaxID=1978226 RepID=UPI003C72888F